MINGVPVDLLLDLGWQGVEFELAACLLDGLAGTADFDVDAARLDFVSEGLLLLGGGILTALRLGARCLLIVA